MGKFRRGKNVMGFYVRRLGEAKTFHALGLALRVESFEWRLKFTSRIEFVNTEKI